MAGEIGSIQHLARNVKQLALKKAEDILSNPDKYSTEIVNETYLTVLKNAVPRTQEITGENGSAIVIQLSKEIADKNVINSSPSDNSKEPSTI